MIRLPVSAARRAALILAILFAGPVSGAAQSLHYPSESLVDRAVPVRLRGLEPGAAISLRTSVRDAQDIEWVARATFRADPAGTVDTARDAPVGGSYAGTQAAGLFNHASPANGDADRRFAIGSMTEIPTSIVLEVNGVVRDSVQVVRRLFAPGVRVEDVAEDRFRGRLFSSEVAQGGGVVVLGGSEGGYPDGLAALLASHGYLALSLPYFGAEGLPDELLEIPIETVVEAVAWLDDRSEGSGDVVLFGTSKGAEGVLLASALSSRPAAVVAYTPSSVVWSCICEESTPSSWSWEGQGVEAVPPGADPRYDPEGGPIRPTVHYAYRKRAAPDVGVIEIERFPGPILLVAGGDDQLWPSAPMAEDLMARRRTSGGHALDQLHVYPGAGHLIGKSFLPAGATTIARGRLETGGSAAENARAQADAWPRVLAFLESVLR